MTVVAYSVCTDSVWWGWHTKISFEWKVNKRDRWMDGKDKKCKVWGCALIALDFSLVYSYYSVSMYSFTG